MGKKCRPKRPSSSPISSSGPSIVWAAFRNTPAVFVVGEDVPDIDDQPTTFDRRDQPERISVGVNDGENIDEVRVRKVPPHFVDVYPLGAFPDGGSASRFPSHPVFSRDNSKFLTC